MITYFAPAIDRLVGFLPPSPRPMRARPEAHALGPAPSHHVDDAAFRDAMAGTVRGVAIVTTNGPGGRAGITVSSVVSASMSPPLLMLSIDRRSNALAALLRNRSFCVNVLAARHEDLADVFAGRPEHGAPYDFGRAAWTNGALGSPVLADAVVALECTLHRTVRAGTSRIVVGRCEAVRAAQGPALLHHERSYGIPLTWTRAVPPARRVEQAAVPTDPFPAPHRAAALQSR